MFGGDNIDGVGLVLYGYLKNGSISINDKLFIGPFHGEYHEINIRNIRNNLDENINTLYNDNSGCLNIKFINKKIAIKRGSIRKGLKITSDKNAYYEFIADVYILHHPTTIRTNYQPNIQCGTISQVAKICTTNLLLRSGDRKEVKFRFLFRPEYIEENSYIIFRENQKYIKTKLLYININGY